MTSTVAILMPGDMGHGVGEALIQRGHRVVSPLGGRSDHTRGLAARAGIEDVDTIDNAVAAADLILSILPPDRAVPQAAAVAEAMVRTGTTPAYADCNAISPDTMAEVAAALADTGAAVIDCGIVGLNPIKSPPTRFYVSGPDTTAIEAIACDALKVIPIGTEIGKGSALKMVYAAGTKGVWTLQTALLLTAARSGVLDALLGELEYSQSAQLAAMRSRIPVIPADSERWVPEMEEIARTFASVGVTDGFHKGAAEIFRVMAETPFASETRETLDHSRTMEQTLAAAIEVLEKR